MFALHPIDQAPWLAAVLADFDAFLLDHAACERKASAMALSLMLKFPDRDPLHEPMIQLAREELSHFHRVFKLMQARGLRFERDQKDPYLRALLPHIRHGRDAALLDRLLLFGVVEARGQQRFAALARGLPDPELRVFYDEIARSEARHADLFYHLAAELLSEAMVIERLDFWLEREHAAIVAVPARAALH